MKKEELERIYDIVEEELGITKEQILSKNREREVVNARRIIALVLLKNKVCTTTKVGELLNRDHSSISHYKKTTNHLLSIEDSLRESFEKINVGFRMFTRSCSPDERMEILMLKKKEIEREIEKLKDEIIIKNKYL